MPLNTQPNINDPDGFYQELIESQRDLDDAQAAMMNAKLVLVLANHVQPDDFRARYRDIVQDNSARIFA